MEARELKKGDVVQLIPHPTNPMFGACFMTIREPKTFGAKGYVQSLGENGKMGGQAYYRANWTRLLHNS